MSNNFVVWRRNDGYVGVTKSLPVDHQTGGAEPTDRRSTMRPGTGEPVTFVKLDEFTDFYQAADLAKQYRKGTIWETFQ